MFLNGVRVVLPNGMIRWKHALWRAKGVSPHWLSPGTRVRLRHNVYRDTLWGSVFSNDCYHAVTFIRESTWLPEGF